MKIQTAVDLMFNRAISVLPMGSIDARQKLKETYHQAKAMEKEQINKACYDGYYKEDEKYTYEYYNETYNK